MSLIDTYNIATGGQNSLDTYTLASNGILIRVEVQPLPPIPIPPIPDAGGGSIGDDWIIPYRKEDKKEITRKRIIVTATVNGKDYVEEIIVEDKPHLTAKDVKVDVKETNDKPKINISFDL